MNLDALVGLRIYTRPYPTTYVQVRTHRKRRINKKWRKRYGFKTVRGKYDPGEIIRVGADFHAYPEVIEQIKAQVKAAMSETPMPSRVVTCSVSQDTRVTRESAMQAMEDLEKLIPSQPERINFFAPVPLPVADPTARYWDSLKFRMKS